jgi:hypothetical protein
MILRGMRLVARTRSIGVFFMLVLFSILFMCVRIPDRLIAVNGIPSIVVDGQINDWQGIEPIVNDTGDVSSLNSYYDLTDCYVLTDPNWFYFLFAKTPVGSAGWIVYFDTDSSNQTGYQINKMGADYRYNQGWESGFYNWTNNDWAQIGSAGTESHGSWVGSGSNSTEWLEGKIAMNALGNPASFRVVFYIKYGEDIAPKTGYVTVVNDDDFAFAACFTSPRHVLSHNETLDLTFRLQNYGSTGISEADVEITEPPHLAIVSGENMWNGTVNSGQTVEVQITAKSLAYGNSTSYASFGWNAGSPQSFTIPLTIVTAPRIALQTQPVGDFKLGIVGAFNVTVTNMDPYLAETTVETLSYSEIDGFSMHIVLGPNSSVQSFYNVTLTEVGSFDFVLHAVSEGIELTRASTFITISKPNMWISSTNVTTSMQLGVEYPLTVTVQNDEDYAYSVNVSATFEYQQPVEAQELTMDLQARSNSTVTLEIKPRETGTYAIKVSLTIYEVALSTEYLYDINIQPNYILPLIYGFIIIVVAAALVYLIIRSRRKRNTIQSHNTKVSARNS